MTGSDSRDDGRLVDVVATHREAAELAVPPLIVLEGLEGFVPGSGPLRAESLGSGHSNATFKISRDGESWVLRRPPRPPLPPTAHDVVREHAIIAAIVEQDVPVPRPIGVCGDSEPIGAPFFLMELVEGSVVRDRLPPRLDGPEGRRGVVEGFVDALVQVHAVEWRGTALQQLGREGGYLERQLRRWGSQWEHNKTRDLPEIEAVRSWLAENLPSTVETTLVHGDYKLDNAIFHDAPPARLAAIVDWEMATLGDPLADLGFFCATYIGEGETADPVLGFSTATQGAGAPARAEIVARYEARSGRVVEHLEWYRKLALWKIAILLEGNYKRFLRGTSDDPFAELLEHGVARIARLAAS